MDKERSTPKQDAYKEWVSENYDRRLELNRQWYARNKEANQAKNKAWYTANKEKANKNSWTQSLWSRYRLTEDQYYEILELQKGVCFICGELPGKQRLSVDHDHNCCPTTPTCGGCTRGLLHVKCNSFLGWLESNLNRVKEYMTKGYYCSTIPSDLADQ